MHRSQMKVLYFTQTLPKPKLVGLSDPQLGHIRLVSSLLIFFKKVSAALLAMILLIKYNVLHKGKTKEVVTPSKKSATLQKTKN